LLISSTSHLPILQELKHPYFVTAGTSALMVLWHVILTGIFVGLYVHVKRDHFALRDAAAAATIPTFSAAPVPPYTLDVPSFADEKRAMLASFA
jgi:hypothetical protein